MIVNNGCLCDYYINNRTVSLKFKRQSCLEEKDKISCSEISFACIMQNSISALLNKKNTFAREWLLVDITNKLGLSCAKLRASFNLPHYIAITSTCIYTSLYYKPLHLWTNRGFTAAPPESVNYCKPNAN